MLILQGSVSVLPFRRLLSSSPVRSLIILFRLRPSLPFLLCHKQRTVHEPLRPSCFESRLPRAWPAPGQRRPRSNAWPSYSRLLSSYSNTSSSDRFIAGYYIFVFRIPIQIKPCYFQNNSVVTFVSYLQLLSCLLHRFLQHYLLSWPSSIPITCTSSEKNHVCIIHRLTENVPGLLFDFNEVNLK